jgi:hypothetical protein
VRVLTSTKGDDAKLRECRRDPIWLPLLPVQRERLHEEFLSPREVIPVERRAGKIGQHRTEDGGGIGTLVSARFFECSLVTQFSLRHVALAICVESKRTESLGGGSVITQVLTQGATGLQQVLGLSQVALPAGGSAREIKDLGRCRRDRLNIAASPICREHDRAGDVHPIGEGERPLQSGQPLGLMASRVGEVSHRRRQAKYVVGLRLIERPGKCGA